MSKYINFSPIKLVTIVSIEILVNFINNKPLDDEIPRINFGI